MKKVFIFAAVIALTMASCGNGTSGNAAENDSTATETTDSVTVLGDLSEDSQNKVEELTNLLQEAISNKDKANVSVVLSKAQAVYKQLVSDGKLEEAKIYGTTIQNLIKENADKIKDVAEGNTTVIDLINTIKNLPTDAKATAEEAAEAAKNIPEEVKNDVKNAADKAVNDVKAAAKETVDKEVNAAKNKADEAAKAAKAKADEAAKKANDKANEAVKKANEKANEAVNDAANKAIDKINSLRPKK